MQKPKVVNEKRISEADKALKAIKEGIGKTPVAAGKSIFDLQPSKFEAKRSPERQDLIKRMKERRQERVAKRFNNSMQLNSARIEDIIDNKL